MGLQPPSEASSPPSEQSLGFCRKKNLEKLRSKVHFLAIFVPLSEAPAPLSEDLWRHPWFVLHHPTLTSGI